MSEGYPFCLYVERLTNPRVAVFVQRGSRCKAAKKAAIPDSQTRHLRETEVLGR